MSNIFNTDRVTHVLSVEELEAPYTEAHLTIWYDYNSGVAHLPLSGKAAGGATSRVVSLHNPIAKKVVDWSVTRIGAKPSIPSPNPDDPNLVLSHMSIGQPVPAVMGDAATLVWTISGRFTYFMRTPPTPGDRLPVATSPALNIPKSMLDIDRGQFKTGLF